MNAFENPRPRFHAAVASIAIGIASCLVGAAGSVLAADSLLSWDAPATKILKIYHAYSASDGRTYIEEIPVPAQISHGPTPGAFVYFDLQPQAVRIAQAPSAELSGWHYAGDSKHLIIPMQGDIGFDVGDGKIYHLKPGEAVLAEDWTGKGHRSGCDATDKAYCVVIDMVVGPNPKTLPLPPPPAH